MSESNTAKEPSSRFLLNIIAQGALSYLLTFFVVARNISGGSELLQVFATLQKLLYCSFIFGIAYGFFRLIGIKGGPVEMYYQNFPFGFAYRNREAVTTSAAAPGASSQIAPAFSRQQGFDWDKLFSAEYLRYAGMLLIVSAIFSLLFRIEWLLIHKLIAAFVVAVASLAGAEIFKGRGAKVLHSYLFLFGVAALQFGITLTGRYYIQNETFSLSELVCPLLGVKLAVAIAMLPLLIRYKADFSAAIYFTILYFAPLSLSYSGFSITLIEMAWFIPLSTLSALLFSYRDKVEGLPVLNCFAANLLLFSVIEGRVGPLWARASIAKFPEEVNYAFAGLLIVYLLQLFFIIISELRHRISNDTLRSFNVFILHIFLLSGLALLVPYVEILQGEVGLILLAASLFPFASYLLLLSLEGSSRTQESLLQCAIILATVGLFLETKGPWSALVFLLYACGILWFALVRKQRTIRIFAFFILTASLFKLYTECFELFDSLSGTTAILIVGGLLLLLANQMEKIKEMIRD